MSVKPGILKWQQLRAYAYPFESPVKFYSDTTHGRRTVDGAVRRINWSFTWADIRNGAGVDADTDGPTMGADFTSSTATNLWHILGRPIMTFYIDPAKIPVGAEIVKATYNFYVYQVYDTLICNPGWCLVQANPASPNNLVAYDYQSLSNTPISDVLEIASVVGAAYNKLTMLDSYLSLIIPGTILRLGIREKHYDIDYATPPWIQYRSAGMDINTVDSPRQPYLEVSWSTKNITKFPITFPAWFP